MPMIHGACLYLYSMLPIAPRRLFRRFVVALFQDLPVFCCFAFDHNTQKLGLPCIIPLNPILHFWLNHTAHSRKAGTEEFRVHRDGG